MRREVRGALWPLQLTACRLLVRVLRVKIESPSREKRMLTYAGNDEEYSRSFGAPANQSTESEYNCSLILLHNLHTEEERERQEDHYHHDRDDSK